nr:MAG TPA: hypothetical protein [Caudoviricetes sp.]
MPKSSDIVEHFANNSLLKRQELYPASAYTAPHTAAFYFLSCFTRS